MHKNHNKTDLVLAISEDKYRQIFENSNETFENQPNKFDLVLTDQIMPNMTGELLARQILKIRPDIPIILCTGFSEFMDKEKLRSSGINDVVLKPVLKSELAQTIRKAINDSQKKS